MINAFGAIMFLCIGFAMLGLGALLFSFAYQIWKDSQ